MFQIVNHRLHKSKHGVLSSVKFNLESLLTEEYFFLDKLIEKKPMFLQVQNFGHNHASRTGAKLLAIHSRRYRTANYKQHCNSSQDGPIIVGTTKKESNFGYNSIQRNLNELLLEDWMCRKSSAFL